MIDFQYLTRGVYGLANAHQAGTMAGHLGAAVSAGYFWGEDLGDLPERVSRGVEAELERIIAGEEAIWFNAKKAGVTPTELFREFPTEAARPELIGTLDSAMRPIAGQLKQSGHDVIFAASAIRALHDHDELSTPSVISGLQKLIERFRPTSPGRGYYGKEKGWLIGSQVQLTEENNFPAYESIQQLAETTIRELIDTASMHRQGFGSLWHLINHAAAIVELDRFGHRELARLCLPAHHQHVRLWRTLPDLTEELGPVQKAEHDPRESVFWDGMLRRDEARLTHRIKTLYGYNVLRQLLEDPAIIDQADDALLYLMA